VAEFAGLLKSYHVRKVTGDHWGGEFVREPFRGHGIEYEVAERPKSDFYIDALALLNSGRVELLDHQRMASQFYGLERRTARSGKESIDHAPGGHDDVVNAVCGALVLAMAAKPLLSIETMREAARIAKAAPHWRTRQRRTAVFF
jgi:hypothetical protein